MAQLRVPSPRTAGTLAWMRPNCMGSMLFSTLWVGITAHHFDDSSGSLEVRRTIYLYEFRLPQAEESFTTKFDFDLVTKVLDENFEHPVWQEISESCIGCSSCTFLCPTCTCFDVIDENDEYNNRGRRIRIWDTCQSCLYTLETSGHNPRPTRIQRCRNRIMHKFSYYPSNYDCLGCVGCGRCITACPVNNELRLIIDKILEIEEKEEGEKISA